MTLSRERIASEFLKLLSYPMPVAAVRLMLARDILKPVLPEITSADLLDSVVRREGAPGHPIRRFAALIGPDPATSKHIAMRLKLSKAQTKRLVIACGWTEPFDTVSALAYRLGIDGARDRLLLGGADAMILDSWKRPIFPITGGSLIKRGLESGPGVAITLAKVENAWIDAGFPEGQAFDALLDRVSPTISSQS